MSIIADGKEGDYIEGVGTISKAPSKYITVDVDLQLIPDKQLLIMIAEKLGLDKARVEA